MKPSARRIALVGSPGSGKTTLASELARRTGLPLHHLDDLYWHEGWTPTPKEAWRSIVVEQVRAPEWIIDGNYADTLDLRIDACDLIIFLDLPRTLCSTRILRRYLSHALGQRELLPARIRASEKPPRVGTGKLAFLRFVWSFPKAVRPELMRQLQTASAATQVRILRSQRDVRGFLADFPLSSKAGQAGAARGTQGPTAQTPT